MIQMFKGPEWNDEIRRYFNNPELTGGADLAQNFKNSLQNFMESIN